MGNNSRSNGLSHINANSIMGFDLLIKVRKTFAFNKSHRPRKQRKLLRVAAGEFIIIVAKILKVQ